MGWWRVVVLAVWGVALLLREVDRVEPRVLFVQQDQLAFALDGLAQLLRGMAMQRTNHCMPDCMPGHVPSGRRAGTSRPPT